MSTDEGEQKAYPTIDYQVSMPLSGGYDVIVVGGGVSGVAASIAAARMGRKTLLVEQFGSLGGTGTNGLVNAFNPFSDGVRTLIGGIGLEVVQRAYERGILAPHVTPETWKTGYMKWIPFQNEGMKVLLDEMVQEAGVELRFFTTMIDVLMDGRRIDGLILHGREGLSAVRGRYFVDCTGDAHLTALAGFPYEVGDEQGRTMPPTLCSHLINIDADAYLAFRESGAWEETLERALEEGAFTVWDKHVPGVILMGENYGFLNAGHVFGVVGLSSEDLTRGMIRGRQLAQEFVAFYRKYVPGFEKVVHMSTAPVLGIRESRRIVGEYILSIDDFLARRSFPDEIGRYNNPIDIHIMSPDPEAYEAYASMYEKRYRLPPGESYGIPYRSLIPKGSQNLLVAGRCISTDRLVQGSTRVMPCCFVTGHAAGAAAALCQEEEAPPLALDAGLLRQTLRGQGAYIP
ncbi:MAG: FAD-dependent oxidoreductase [Anaerolineae bacterium]|nr:FAD-dependent oxidoreductase [Anaerolineae bacterium]